MANCRLAYAEALAQNVVGLLVAFIVMKLLNVQTDTVLQIQVTLFILSYIRSYYIRKLFHWLYKRLEHGRHTS